MVHGPCGAFNPRFPCVRDGQCFKGYPEAFLFVTVEKQGYSLYASPQDSRVAEEGGVRLDNRLVAANHDWLHRNATPTLT